MKIKAINGFKDILPEETPLWRHIEATARDVFTRFGFREIRLPILEKTELFARSIGETTDIVEKEMYSFTEKGITMRPEATASLLRAFVEHGMHVQQPVQRLFTIGPMFRHERPQKGRLRQFHQIDAELLGAQEALTDAELMAMGALLLEHLGVSASLEINSLGCPACRPAFRAKLLNYLDLHVHSLCSDCKRRKDSNPLRVIDCKDQGCRSLVREAPSIVDSLCPACASHFSEVREGLELLGVNHTVNHFMVRGLDYYCRTTFEFLSGDLGAQAAVGAGGRYDGLIEELGGPGLPGIGFALGVERLVLLLQAQGQALPAEDNTDIFVVALGEAAIRYGSKLVHQLRRQGVCCAMDYSRRSLKAQMKLAARCQARFTLILGEDELTRREATLRNMNTQEQNRFPLNDTIEDDAAVLLSSLRR